jgi:hypothetical protein
MLLNLVQRWILSPLESCQSPMVEDWQACAAANGCTPEQIAHVCDKAEEFFPSYGLPVCRQYGRWDSPFHGDGWALCYCEMDITHLAAAQKDNRLVIFSGLDDPIPQHAIEAHAHLFAEKKSPRTLRELMNSLSHLHVKFSAI